MSFLHILWDNMKSYLDYIVYLLEKFDIEIIVSYEVFWKRFCETVAMERIFCTFKQIYFYTSFIKRNETAFCKMTLQLKNQSRLTSFFNMKANKEWPVWYSSYTVPIMLELCIDVQKTVNFQKEMDIWKFENNPIVCRITWAFIWDRFQLK